MIIIIIIVIIIIIIVVVGKVLLCMVIIIIIVVVVKVFVYGDNKPHTVALVVLNQLEIQSWINNKTNKTNNNNNNIWSNEKDFREFVDSSGLLLLLRDELDKVSMSLKSYEKPVKVVVVIVGIIMYYNCCYSST